MPNAVQLAVNIGEQLKLNPTSEVGIADTPGYGSLGEFISTMLPNIYVLASIIIFILLIIGGFVIMTSGDSPEKKGKGSKAITAAVLGFAIIFVSIWLIKLIEFLTGIKIFEPNL